MKTRVRKGEREGREKRERERERERGSERGRDEVIKLLHYNIFIYFARKSSNIQLLANKATFAVGISATLHELQDHQGFSVRMVPLMERFLR